MTIQEARDALMDILSNYVAFTKTDLTLVFDAYLVKDGTGSDFMHDGYRVVYTKENETADAYIEALANEIGSNYAVRVASSDGLVQLSSFRSGVLRMSARELWEEIHRANRQMQGYFQGKK